jgi:hypothetical protein
MVRANVVVGVFSLFLCCFGTFSVSYAITFTGLNCDTNLPLLQASSDFLIPPPVVNMTSTASTLRLQRASDKLTGSVLLAYQGSQWEELPVNVSSRRLAASLVGMTTGAQSSLQTINILC